MPRSLLDPGNAQAWYNLGLAQHADNELDAALTSFQQAPNSIRAMRTRTTSRVSAMAS